MFDQATVSLREQVQRLDQIKATTNWINQGEYTLIFRIRANFDIIPYYILSPSQEVYSTLRPSFERRKLTLHPSLHRGFSSQILNENHENHQMTFKTRYCH